MQTKSILTIAPVLAGIVSAAPQSWSAMPTLSSTSWYDWSTVSVEAVSTTTAIASSVSDWDTWDTWTAWADATVSASTTTAAAAAVVTSSSSYSYDNPFTIYTTETNSWGVITGMPAVVTSQPAVATVAAGATNSTTSTNYTNTTMATSTVSKSSSASGTGFQQSASASIATHTGAASLNHVGGTGLALAVLGFAFSCL